MMSAWHRVQQELRRFNAPRRVHAIMKDSYDFLVLGGGSAGYAAARTAHDLGLSVAVVDGARELGGLCILRGCMPSKTLIESANRFRSMRRAPEFGLRAGSIEVHPGEIIARKRRLIGEFADYRRGQLEDGRFDLIRGTARFSGPNGVVVTLSEGQVTREIGFRTALVATGSVVTRLPVPGLEETGYWTSDEILDAESIPDRIIVLGGGAIALEMACYLEGLGKSVSVIQRSERILSGCDADVAGSLEEALRCRDSFSLHTGTRLVRVVREPSGAKTVHFEQHGTMQFVTADEILQAVGRRPNTASLNAPGAGIVLDEDGRILCDSRQRTSAPHLFAAGDVCGPHEIVHIAIEQGEIAAHNAAVHLGKCEASPREIDYRLKLLGIFTDPQVATVGLSEAEARSAGIPVAAATYPFDDHGKSLVMGETDGFVKLVADTRNGELIGAAVIGPEAVELIHEIVVAMHFRATASQLSRIPHYHPTLSEIWTYPAEELSIHG
jgi:pyruvate/2-oxoglutarate dehydrogenase complex dihydrolipoamide dehydrogenase (E3) component